MRINRKEFLKRLLCVACGLAEREKGLQETCLVFRSGRVYTYNGEIACSVVSDVDEAIEGAIAAPTLLSMLKQLPDDEIEISSAQSLFVIKADSKKTTLPFEMDIKIPINEIELPSAWTELPQNFAEAVDIVHRCTKSKDNDAFAKTCVHMHPDFLEAADDFRFIRYMIPTFVKKEILVRGSSIKEIVTLGMTKAAETANWLHFRNPMGLRVSIKKLELESYPNLDNVLDLRGQEVEFPKGLKDAANRAGLVIDKEDGGGSILLYIEDGEIDIVGKGASGSHHEFKKVKHKGNKIKFRIPPKLLSEIIDKGQVCEISEATIRVDGGNYTFATLLEM